MGTSQWYYVKDGAQRGPIDETDLSRLIQHGALPPETPVFQDGLGGDWTAAKTTGVFPLNATAAPVAQAKQPRVLMWSMAAALATVLITGALLFNQQKNKSQDALAEQEQKLFLLNQELAANAEVLDQHESSLANTQNSTDLLDVENSQLRARIQTLTDQLNKANGDLEGMQNATKNMQAQFAQTSTLHAQAKDQLKILETQANAQAEENKQLQAQIQELRNNPEAANAQTAVQLRAAMTALKTANEKVDHLTRQLAQAERNTNTPTTAKTTTPKPTPPTSVQIPTPVPAPVTAPVVSSPNNSPVGSVVQIVAQHGFAIVNIGTNQGVKKNDTFFVRNKSTGQLIGTLRINNPMADVASADLGQLPIQNLTPGDTLHPTSP